MGTLFVTLMLMLPCQNAGWRWVPVEEREDFADSIATDCSYPPGTALQDLDSLHVYASPVEGGGYRRVFSKRVRGLECRGDTTNLALAGWSGAHFYVSVTDTVGNESCPSGVVYKGPVTAVTELGAAPRNAEAVWFDVHGRRIPDHMIANDGLPVMTGIFWSAWRVNGRLLKWTVRKRVVLR